MNNFCCFVSLCKGGYKRSPAKLCMQFVVKGVKGGSIVLLQMIFAHDNHDEIWTGSILRLIPIDIVNILSNSKIAKKLRYSDESLHKIRTFWFFAISRYFQLVSKLSMNMTFQFPLQVYSFCKTLKTEVSAKIEVNSVVELCACKRHSTAEKWNTGALSTILCPENQLFWFSPKLYQWLKIIFTRSRNLSGVVHNSDFWDTDPVYYFTFLL